VRALRDRQRRCGGGIEQWRFEMTREHHARINRERMVVFAPSRAPSVIPVMAISKTLLLPTL